MQLNREHTFRWSDFLVLAACVCACFFVVWSFTGTWPLSSNPYNNYALQSRAWLEGHLDLGQNHPHLELAVLNGKYYVSFPPFPSLVLLPFAVVLGTRTPDHLVTLAMVLLAGLYALRLYGRKRGQDGNGLFWSLFLLIGGGTVFVSVNGWVWFMAQSMCLAFMIMSLYYADCGKVGRALFFLACAVGCRPFEAVCLPLILVLLYRSAAMQAAAAQSTEAGKKTVVLLHILRSNWFRVIPAVLLVLFYMWLNAARFGNVLEFGHNYLPEFTKAGQSQFGLRYFGENLGNLFHLPGFKKNGVLDYPVFNGFAFWLVSPLFVSGLVYGIRRLVRGPRRIAWVGVLLVLAMVVELGLILLHRTMGGWHFGNRYVNDILPLVFYSLVLMIPADDRLVKYQYPLFMLGMVLNTVGTIAVYNNWI